MKKISNVFLMLAFVSILPFAGCNISCGGIVKSFEIKDEYIEIKEGSMLYGMVESGYYPQLRVTFKQGTTLSDDCCCSELTIYAYDFENYGANNLEDLLINTDFLTILQDEHRISTALVVNNVTTPTTYFGGTDTLAYLLYYDFYEEYIESPIIENPADYKGYIKVN